MIGTSAGAQVQLPPAPAFGEPIIPDSEFEEALPPLDPDLGAPLPPIEDFEMPAGVFPPDPGPVEEAPLGDPALLEPLPPLATFDVQPVDPAAEEDPERPAEIRYTLVIEGLDEVGLTGRFRGLSALHDARGRAANGAMVAARAREDEALAVRLLRSEGYYDAVATSSVEQVPDEPGMLRAVISAAPGQRYHFGDIRIEGPPTEPAGIAREALRIDSGDPIVAAQVEAAEANVLLRLPQQGYPFPELGLRDIELDQETALGDYTLPLNPGPRARFRGFTTEGDLAFDADHVGILARFEPGQLYDRRLVDDLREAMVATRLFSTVSAEPVRTGETAPDGTEYVNILVRQQAGPARSLDANAGFSTGEGFRLEAAWEHRNLFPPEGALRVAAVGGTQEQSLIVRFRRNNWGQRDRQLLIQAEAGRRNHPAFEGYRVQLQGLISRESTPIWQKRWTYAYGAEILATNENRFGRPRVAFTDAYFIAGLIGQLGYDRSNSLLDPTRGFRLLARVNPEVQHRLGDTDYYARNLFEATGYFPFGESFVLAGRARVGSIYGIGRDELAPSRRLYSGGGGSVRGFGFQQLGPKEEIPNPRFDPENPDDRPATLLVPLGGRSLNEFALEGRYRFGNYGVVAFVDAGQVYETEYPTFDNIRFGVGVGARLYTNFGPMRVDIATPINRQPGESRFNIYVSIGQAF
ncbi:MAG: autotransporter assembly complex protein TamA [Allosphingosinicella sp.]|uniref:autotransporter assembly complex protein TamA n=1 Tax=Allosphingosinicella sp. TaxID=2823234 RepID=UPI00392AFCDE